MIFDLDNFTLILIRYKINAHLITIQDGAEFTLAQVSMVKDQTIHNRSMGDIIGVSCEAHAGI